MSAHRFSPWTSRDLDILRTLALRVRLLALPNIASLWWEPSGRQLANARGRLLKLVRAGFLHRYVLNVHPPLELSAPGFCWSPGEGAPDCEKLSYQFRQRWTEIAKPTSVYIATKRTVNLFAGYGKGRVGNSLEWDHDLHVGQIYCFYRDKRPEEAQRWMGEDAFPTAGFQVKEPDAFLHDGTGSRIRAIEFAGKYDAERVYDFHTHCRKYELPYELW